MLRIAFVLMLVPLIMAKSLPIDLIEIKTVIDFAKKIVQEEKDFVDSLAEKNTSSALTDTLARMKKTVQHIEYFDKMYPLQKFFWVIDDLRPTMEFDHVTIELLSDLDEFIDRIENWFKSYKQYSNSENIALNEEKFDKWIIKLTSGAYYDLPYILKYMYVRIMSPGTSGESSLFYNIAAKLPEMPEIVKCGRSLSLQQRVSYFYQIVALYQMKGFIMHVHGLSLQAISRKSMDKSVYDLVEAHMGMSIMQYALATKSAMISAPKTVATCDVEKKNPNQYTSLAHTFEYIIINLMETNPEGRCHGYCRDINNQKPQECYWGGNYCSNRECVGTLSECMEFNEVDICELPLDNGKRYEWVRHGNKYYGNPTTCGAGGDAGRQERASTFRGPDGRNCDVCFCKCTADYSNVRAIRSVSFRPQITNINDNWVLAGVRIIEDNGLIHLQIRHGKLMSHGHIDPSLVAWKEIEKISFMASEETDYFDSYHFFNEITKKWQQMKEREDYISVETDKSDGINIDRIDVDDDYVLTGVRWGSVENSGKLRWRIEVHATKYDYKTGKLDPATSKWITPDNMPNPPKEFYNRGRREYNMASLNDPLRATSPNIEKTEPNQYLRFTVTSREGDAGQHTVPYFDTQQAATTPPIAFTGLEIYYRAADNFGGFIALRLHSVDLSKTWNIELNNDDFSKYKSHFSAAIAYDLGN